MKVRAQLIGVETEYDPRTNATSTYLALRLADGQRLRVPTDDKRQPATILKRLGSEEYIINVEQA